MISETYHERFAINRCAAIVLLRWDFFAVTKVTEVGLV
jgi:hypothetical protein